MFTYTGTGGIFCYGLAIIDVIASTSVAFTAQWKIYNYVGISPSFQWAVGDAPLMWYVVATTCGPSPNGGCQAATASLILAKSPSDVCDQLTAQNFQGQVASIKQYSQPASSPPNDNQTLTNVPFSQVPSCLPLTVDFDELIYMGMQVTGMYTLVFTYNAAGGIYAYGSAATYVPPFRYDGSGGIECGGDADNESSGYYYVPDPPGDITLGGGAIFACSYWVYDGEGDITLGGGAIYVSPYYHYDGEGDITLGGSELSIYTFVSSGVAGPELAGIHFRSHTRISLRNLRFGYDGEGGIILNSGATSACSSFGYDGEGDITLSGAALCISSRFVYDGSGDITINGSFRRFYPVVFGYGGISMDGHGPFSNNYSYDGNGGIILGGGSLNVSPYYFYAGTGDITLSDEAYSRSNFFGTLVIYGGVACTMSDLSVDFSVDNASVTLTAPTTVLVGNACNCPSLTLVLNLTHNFTSLGYLIDFLARNNLSIVTPLKMYYDGVNEVWRSNLYLKSTGDPETWTIINEWYCTSNYGSPAWVFSSLFKRNTGTRQNFDSRILIVFSPDNLCGDPSTFNFSFQVNTTSDLVVVNSNIIIETEILYDNIGLFRSAVWLNNPLLSINITDNPPQAAGPMYNLTPFTTETQPAI